MHVLRYRKRIRLERVEWKQRGEFEGFCSNLDWRWGWLHRLLTMEMGMWIDSKAARDVE